MDVRSWIRVGIVAGIVTIFLALVGLIGRFVDLNLVGEQVTFARLVLISAPLVAGLAAGLRVTPIAVRRPITTAVSAVLVLGFLQRIIPIALDQLDLERDWLYSRSIGGLTWLGAIAVAATAAGLSVLNARKGRELRARLFSAGEEKTGVAPAQLVFVLVLVVVLVAVPWVVGEVISQVLIYVLLGIGLNIVVGYAGLLDLGYVFFFAVGAYSTALLTGAALNTFTGSGPPAVSLDLSFYLAIPMVLLIAACAGLLIGAPVLRLRGDYLALVTLGLGEMVTVLVRSPWLVPLVGGPNGMRGVSDAAIAGFGFREPQHFYYLALGFVLLAVFVSWRLSASRIGRAWTAMREDEQTAEAMGVNTTRFKLLAFAMGGAIGSLGGSMFAVQIGSLTPQSFEVTVSILVLGLVILGGLGSLPGVVVGALVLVGLPGLLREFEEYRGLAYGAALVAVMVLRTQGLVPNVRRSRELQEEERAQDQWAHEKEADVAAVGGMAP